MAKTFYDRYGAASKQDMYSNGLENIAELEARLAESAERVSMASVAKVEALLVQAFKITVKTTQRDLVGAQLTAIAGDEYIKEHLIHPALLTWGKGIIA